MLAPVETFRPSNRVVNSYINKEWYHKVASDFYEHRSGGRLIHIVPFISLIFLIAQIVWELRP